MQSMMEKQLKDVITKALVPDGFELTGYEPAATDRGIMIFMIKRSTNPPRAAAVSITEDHRELEFSDQRIFRLQFHVGEALVDSDKHVDIANRKHGILSHTLRDSERRKFNRVNFFCSPKGMELLEETRKGIQEYCVKLDLLARGDQLRQSAKRILQADKDQHRTLLASGHRKALNKWLAQKDVSEKDLKGWIAKGEQLQNDPQSILESQANPATPKQRASDEQLEALVAWGQRHRAS